MSIILELFGIPTTIISTREVTKSSSLWRTVVTEQHCPYLGRKCVKVRKSEPYISIGNCTIHSGVKKAADLIVCPHRFLERRQVFMDSIHLLALHEPGNELHLLREVGIPGGNVDYFLVSVRKGKVVDYVGIELQALDTTGTVWPERQAFLADVGVIPEKQVPPRSAYNINWKMSAKTILVQLHHKIETFEHLGKHFVLVLQEDLLQYMERSFNFGHVEDAKLGNPMHFHSYDLDTWTGEPHITLNRRLSTDTNGINRCLGIKTNPHLAEDIIIAKLQALVSTETLFTI